MFSREELIDFYKSSVKNDKKSEKKKPKIENEEIHAECSNNVLSEKKSDHLPKKESREAQIFYDTFDIDSSKKPSIKQKKNIRKIDLFHDITKSTDDESNLVPEDQEHENITLSESIKLIEMINDEALTMKELKSKMIKKGVEAGIKIVKDKIPLKIRKGILQKHKNVMGKLREEEKDVLGKQSVSMKSLTNKVSSKLSPFSTTKNVAESLLKSKTKKTYRERGLKGSIGRYKDGCLHITEKDLKQFRK